MIAGSPGVGRREHGGAGAVAEQHARRAIGVVDDARHDVGADDERVLARRRSRPSDAPTLSA